MKIEEVKRLFLSKNINDFSDEELKEIIKCSETNNVSKGDAWINAFGEKFTSTDIRKELKRRGYLSQTLFYKPDDKEPIISSDIQDNNLKDKILMFNVNDTEKTTYNISKENKEALNAICERYPGATKTAVFNAVLSEVFKLF